MSTAPVAHQRFLRGTTGTLSFTNVDSDGTSTAAAGAVTVGVTKADGTEVIAAGTATSGSNPYTKALTAAQTGSLNVLTATWTDAGDSSAHTTLAEIVGGYYFSIAEARAFDSSITADRYPDALVLAARREVEEECERITRCAFVPRFRRELVDGTGTNGLILDHPFPRRIVSVRTYSGATYTEFSTDELNNLAFHQSGVVVRRDGSLFTAGHQNLVVEYEHGFDRPPNDLRHAALTRLRFLLNSEKSGIPERAASWQVTDFGTFGLATPGQRGAETGIPAVDATYDRYAMHMPLVG